MASDTNPLLPILSVLEASGTSNALTAELDRAAESGQLTAAEQEAIKRINENLSRGKRRENLLRVLLETTTDLVGITDFEAMLQAIVRRTRMLLGSDMAYISLNDFEKHETYIHSTDGVATEAYRNIRMELGTGVLGKIAEGTGSAQVINYLSDPDITHIGDIDAVVQSEGVRSIMGAPLMRDGVLLGALLVAERYQRQYSDEQVWLVESMSALACVALSNARIIGDLKAALTERDAFQTQLETEHQRIADSQLFERALVDSVVTTNPYEKFHGMLLSRHSEGVWLVDEAGRLIHGENSPSIPATRIERTLSQGHRASQVEHLRLESGEEYSLLAVSAATRPLGGILVSGQVSGIEERLLRRAGVVLSVLRLMDENSREQSVKAQAGLVRALVRPEADFEQFTIQRAQRFGLVRDEIVYVYAIASDSRIELVIDALRTHQAFSSGAFAEVNGHAVLIHPELLDEQIIRMLAQHDLAATIAVEHDLKWSGSLAAVHAKAERTLRAMLALGLTSQTGSEANLGIVGMLMSSASPEQVRTIIDVELGPLLEYDGRRGTQLIHTLWVYFTCDRHHVDTARELHIHPNTLRQRFERISAMLGDDWASARRSSMTFLALQLLQLREDFS